MRQTTYSNAMGEGREPLATVRCSRPRIVTLTGTTRSFFIVFVGCLHEVVRPRGVRAIGSHDVKPRARADPDLVVEQLGERSRPAKATRRHTLR
jgi:hypothetical protein